MDVYKTESVILESNQIINLQYQFGLDVLTGLLKTNKQLYSKYLYDKTGCELYNKITSHADYYLTNCEIEILEIHGHNIIQFFNDKSCNLIEFGPGQGIKTQIILQHLFNNRSSFEYFPVDISVDYIKKLTSSLKIKFPKLKTSGIVADYINGLNLLRTNSNQRNIVLFFGSSIGNFTTSETYAFLHSLWNVLNNNDIVLIGFDLRKNIEILKRAYDDSQGITRKFNLNFLQRINRELDANFQLNKFCHYASYNPISSAMESYLVSQEKQMVTIGKLQQNFHFKPWEAIHLEHSQKYLLSDINQFAKNTGFEVMENFTGSKNYFVDSLWRVIKYL